MDMPDGGNEDQDSVIAVLDEINTLHLREQQSTQTVWERENHDSTTHRGFYSLNPFGAREAHGIFRQCSVCRGWGRVCGIW